MPKEKSEAYFKQLCEEPAIKTLEAILYCKQLTYSGRILLLCLLLIPRYKYGPRDPEWKPVTGYLRKLATRLGVHKSSISRWNKRLKGLNPFETRLMEATDGKGYTYLINKRATTP